MHPLSVIPLAAALALSPTAALARQQTSPAPEAPLTAEAIMARVAANQDRSELERTRYLYVQHARVLSRKRSTLMCEEITESRITPASTGASHQQLLQLNGRLLEHHRYTTYTTPLPPHQEAISNHDDSLTINVGDNDRALVEDMRSSLTADSSKDGLSARLFPLTSRSQQSYRFHLVGQEQRNGRTVYHLDFRPRDKDDFGWKGDAYIDTLAFQPVLVSTAMARKIPFAVRTLLGTSLPGLGFTVTYAPQPDGPWFPVSFGTEFKIHVLFFFEREIVIDAQNRGFEKTHVTTTMVEAAAPTAEQPPVAAGQTPLAAPASDPVPAAAPPTSAVTPTTPH